MRYLLILIVFLFIAIPGFSQADTLEMESYSFVVPEGWKIKEGCVEEECSLLAPHDDVDDTFLENINIVIAKAPSKNYAVKKYADFSVGYLPSVIDDFKVLEREVVNNFGEYVVYSGVKNDFAQTWKQYYFIKGEGLYIITFTAEKHRFDSYIDKIQNYLDSFKIK